jgi:intraflagellar transport protein 172
MDVSITKQALKRLEEQSKLSSNAVTRFRRKIYQIVSGQVCAGQIAKMHGHQCIFRIRFNISLRIIATVVKTDSKTEFRILDFVTHDQMDGREFNNGKYFNKTNDPIDVQDFDYEFNNDPEIPDYDSFICSNEKLQIDLNNFESHREDFYWHIPDHENTQDIDILLSSIQKELVKKQLPILLSGSAGSGKTTILIYHALEKSFEDPINKVLYVTYNKFLKKEAERIAEKVCSNVPQNLRFCSYLDLLRSSYVDTNQFNEAQEVNQQRFMNEFYRTRSSDFRGVDPILVWQEIRNLIKGSVFAIEENKKLLTFDEYQSKKNESSLTDWSLFSRVHSLAEKYQGWIESQSYWDEIDITQNALFNISNSLTEEGKYAAIYCDEIQDLTKNQISLLLKILKKRHYELPNFFFAGDPAQIINPSGFSWKKVKDLIFNLYNNLPKSQSVEHDELKLNFRSTKGIVNLGQKILEFNDGSTGELLSQEAHREGGDMPFVVNIAEPDILRDNDDFGSRNAIIVANEQEKNKLKKQFSKDGIESERIFLFTEVKGLEFDQVLVWKFFEYFNGWRTNSQELERFKYNLLYVCTTRARERLYFYEGENANAFWQSSRIEKCISITDFSLD